MKEKIIGLFVGKPDFIRPNGQKSAINKKSVNEILIALDHLAGDEVADKKHHGGQKRVLHHYSIKNYQKLAKTFPKEKNKFIPGSYGENITTENIDEKDLYLGDVFKLGSAEVELTIPRFPCSTIDDFYGFRGVLKEVVQTGYIGWFYRIKKAGIVTLNDSIELIARPNPTLNLYRLIEMSFNRETSDKKFIETALALDLLDDGWSKKLERLKD